MPKWEAVAKALQPKVTDTKMGTATATITTTITVAKAMGMATATATDQNIAANLAQVAATVDRAAIADLAGNGGPKPALF